jgi:hypothetical protein
MHRCSLINFLPSFLILHHYNKELILALHFWKDQFSSKLWFSSNAWVIVSLLPQQEWVNMRVCIDQTNIYLDPPHQKKRGKGEFVYIFNNEILSSQYCMIRKQFTCQYMNVCIMLRCHLHSSNHDYYSKKKKKVRSKGRE